MNVHEELEVRYWTEKFGVSADELNQAVQVVGVSAEVAAKHLGKSAYRVCPSGFQ